MKSHKVYDGKKLIGRIYFFLDYDNKITDKKRFVKKLIKEMKKTKKGWCGYKTKAGLEYRIAHHLFDEKKYHKLPKYKFDIKKIISIISNSLTKCNLEINSKVTKIHIIPNFNPLTDKDLNGVYGFSEIGNNIVIFLNPKINGWKTELKKTICHEFAHVITLQYYNWDPLINCIIFEGLGEHFREKVVGGKIASWSKIILRKECKKWFKKLKNKLNSTSFKLYYKVFFGSEKYPRWLGYTLGYQIVGDFLKKNKDLSWNEIIKIKPKEVLKRSGWK
jgi:uncharacterized protein YjaZ